MATTQETNIEILEKLADGNHKIKYPKTKVEQVIGLVIASKAESEVGTNNTRYMTPLRVKEAINSLLFYQKIVLSSAAAKVDITIPSNVNNIEIICSNMKTNNFMNGTTLIKLNNTTASCVMANIKSNSTNVVTSNDTNISIKALLSGSSRPPTSGHISMSGLQQSGHKTIYGSWKGENESNLAVMESSFIDIVTQINLIGDFMANSTITIMGW